MVKLEDHIILENEDFIGINKPSGLLTIPDREGKDVSLKQLLKVKYNEIFTVHRLDRDTSGIVVFARTEEAHRHLSQQFENRETRKIYNGLVLGVPSPLAGIINEPISELPNKKGVMSVYKKGKESITEYEVLNSFRSFSYLQFHILTGRTHQIRVHMKFLGHPIVCDPIYGDGKPLFISQLKHNYKLSQAEDEERPMLNRLALHSAELTFTGIRGEEYNLKAPLPKDMKATLSQLTKWAERKMGKL
jgi:23S rRNA pseudouridine955/2504/2580 synthase/23S rRNA pseudouridine1911/1915/1917 synthase